MDVLNTVTLLRHRGVHVRSIADGIDPATSTGLMMLNMLATLPGDHLVHAGEILGGGG